MRSSLSGRSDAQDRHVDDREIAALGRALGAVGHSAKDGLRLDVIAFAIGQKEEALVASD